MCSAANPSTGALTDAGCVQELPAAAGKSMKRAKKKKKKRTKPRRRRTDAPTCPGLKSVESIAVSGDGSMVYALGSALGGGVREGSRQRKAHRGVVCGRRRQPLHVAYPSPGSIEGAAVSPDGRFLYVDGPQGEHRVRLRRRADRGDGEHLGDPAGIARAPRRVSPKHAPRLRRPARADTRGAGQGGARPASAVASGAWPPGRSGRFTHQARCTRHRRGASLPGLSPAAARASQAAAAGRRPHPAARRAVAATAAWSS